MICCQTLYKRLTRLHYDFLPVFIVKKMKQFLSFNDQESCYQFFTIFRCFRFENWNNNSVSINFEKYRISKKLIDFYRLLSNAIDYRYYRLTTPGNFVLRLHFVSFQVTVRSERSICLPALLMLILSMLF